MAELVVISAEFNYHAESFDIRIAVSGLGSSPKRGTCETNKALPRDFFSRFSRVRPTY